ncbi:Fanconi anemia group J protein homolog isoform X2 [Colias croceus]|uniref:Fanconi anemia group J protein homolog isoform X2 n=1 Tax=Colias crocea TaxID=72248 RepID=UPI001E281488|nr:Fanconi anemia group J protein homolog isoform X2 [Colias croceus]
MSHGPNASPKKMEMENPFSTEKPTVRNITSNQKYKALLTTQSEPGVDKMIGGVKVNLPVNPYGSQIALMSMVIKAINKSQNCLLESPTGSGKTLALLCASLAAQKHKRDQVQAKLAQDYFQDHPELSTLQGNSDLSKCNSPGEDIFSKANNDLSIYSKPSTSEEKLSTFKRLEPCNSPPDTSTDSPELVSIHKRQRLSSPGSNKQNPGTPVTPEKKLPVSEPTTPQDVRTPTIYYGARTHKQIQQVVKEFSRTVYWKQATMSVLSSREYSCIREFDRKQWASKNDMCRGCVKTYEGVRPGSSNCQYYDNRKALNHKTLAPVFDLEDIVMAGEQLKACPYYAARELANAANIVFCPYNYLIEPSIRESMQINVTDNIIIIDEAHNIEDVCRDAATFTVKRAQIAAAILELQKMAEYKYQDSMGSIEYLAKILSNWDQWFVNQTPLLNKQPEFGNEVIHVWAVENFMATLNNHNIGMKQYGEFQLHAEMFVRKLREDPRAMLGATQATGILIETIATFLGYLFRDMGKFADDFVPALVRSTADEGSNVSWRSSQQNQTADDDLVLRLICMNPAVVFAALKPARCIILASGTLTPLVSLHSELGADFPLQVSPSHVIPRERVWIGTLYECPDGSDLDCTSRASNRPGTQDALGATLLHVCRVTPAGVLCFLPSYRLMNVLVKRWRETDVWDELNRLKNVFSESRNVRDHNEIMEDYYHCTTTQKGAVLFAVYRGKVSEGMDFKDHQARAVIIIGVPFPNMHDVAVKEKIKYNDKYSKSRNLLSGSMWLQVQAYRALNQAVGRCVRHQRDWGAVLLADARFRLPRHTDHLSKWVRSYMGNNHHTYNSLLNSDNNLESFMKAMTLQDLEDSM